MAIQYKELFDFDGLDAAFKDLEQSEDQFARSVIDDLKRIQKQSAVTKSELLKLADALKKINVTNSSGRDWLGQLAAQSEAATRAFIEQNNALTNNRAIMAAVREEVARLKAEYIAQRTATEENRTKSAEYRAEIDRLKAAQQQLRNELAASRVTQQQSNAETQRSRAAQAQLREELARTRLEEARNTAEHRRLTQEQQRLTAATRAAGSAITVAAGSYREAQQRLTTLGNSIRNAENGFESQNADIRAQITEYNRLNDALKRFDAQMGNHQRNVGNYGGSLQGVIGMLSGLAASYLSAGAALSFAFEKNLSLDSLTAALTFTLGSSEAADKKLKELRKTSEFLGLEFLTLANSYKSFAGAAIASNYSLKDTDRIFMSVSKAAAVLKLSNDQLGGALTAIQQMISKGNVQAEELRGQLGERLPGAFAIAARALGVTTQELDKMLKKGEVLAADLLPKLADELDKTFGDKIQGQVSGMQAEMNNLKNTMEEIATSGGLNTWFEDIIRGANKTLTAIKNLTAGFINSFKNLRSPEEFRKSAEESRKEEVRRKTNSTNLSIIDKYEGIGVSKAQMITADNSSEVKLNKRLIEQRAELTRLWQRYNYFKQLADPYNEGTNALQYANAVKQVSELNGKVAIQQSLVRELKEQYSELYPEIDQKTRNLTDAELKSVAAIQKRISELKKLDGSAVIGTEVYGRIEALKARLKELSDHNKKSNKEAKDGISLLEDQITKMERALQLQALAAKNKGMEFAPSKEALEKLDELRDKLQYVKDVLNGVNRNKLGELTQSATSANSSLSTSNRKAKADLRSTPALFAMSDKEIFDAMSESITKGEKKLTDMYATELGRRRDAAEKALEKQKEAMHLATEYIARSFEKVSDVVGEQWSDLFYSMTDAMHHFIDSMKNGLEDGKLSFQDFANIANGLISGINGTMQESSQTRIDQFTKERDRAIEGAGDNADARIKIEEDYQRKVTTQKRKAAQQEKQMALLSIAVNTAAAVMSVLSTGGGAHYLDFGVSAGILSAFVTGVGIAQAALVLSKPIPQFYTGTENAPEGIAEIAERGPELQINPDGSKELNTKRQYKYLKRGTKIKNADDTANWLSANQLFIDKNGNLSAMGNSDELSGNMSKMNNYHYVMMSNTAEKFDYDRMGRMFDRSVKSIPFDEHHFDDRGYSKYRVETNARIKDLNARNSRGGN
ncbi:tape measure protein [Pedobacter agri]|uniref:Tape measure protein n=1 Tax=Pedobacter agri TaxID=454586 RepID=A0A9X3DCD7_9SPHI|nr:tape measure protein [Pedobacter agri]MCX3264819.1 tape measure protein [Pedobacter agri]